MDVIEIIVTCANCSHDAILPIQRGGGQNHSCKVCGRTLLKYVPVNGYIYILSNPKMKKLLKIGFSTRAVEERVAELSSATGVPTPFELEAYFLSAEPERHEKEIHSRLAERRIPGREFFEVSLEHAINVAQEVCRRAPTYCNRYRSSDFRREPYDSNYEHMRRTRG